MGTFVETAAGLSKKKLKYNKNVQVLGQMDCEKRERETQPVRRKTFGLFLKKKIIDLGSNSEYLLECFNSQK